MNCVIYKLAKIRLLKGDFDYNLARASMELTRVPDRWTCIS
jgi:hypothetical protein